MRPHPRVLVAGSGVAALEALLALHELAGPRVRLELMAPGTAMLLRPASVAEPFGLGGPPPVQLTDIAAYCSAHHHSAILAEVRPDERRAVTGTGETIDYDHLVVAVGARSADVLPGALPFGGPADVPGLEQLLARAERGEIRRLAFASPAAAGWSLPVYELAMLAAADLRDRGARTEITIVTAEPTALWVFGPPAGEAIRRLLEERDIRLVHGQASGFADGLLSMRGRAPVPADAVVALPPVQGPWIQGVPSDDRGFLPVDDHGRLPGVPGVWAAGDATAFPIKQGGLACQQADAVAAGIAAELGANVATPPFRPVLRGLLLTGGAPLYLRAEMDASGVLLGHRASRLKGEVSTRALWWPPGKVAGHYLAPYLATARPRALGREPLVDRAATASAPAADATDAVELALLLADSDAQAGDYTQALHALDAAAALSGGVLPAEAARRRDAWRPRIAGRPHPVPINHPEEEP
jgi:sulfide:quinone oxidoreductase